MPTWGLGKGTQKNILAGKKGLAIQKKARGKKL